jgi:Domain of unknown function (DUF4340)
MTLRRALVALLAVQALLVAVTWWPGDRSDLAAHALLDLDPAAVTRIRIARKPAEGQPERWLELARGEGGAWSIESASGYPAQASRVDALLAKLVTLEVRSPIATQTTSHDALAVGERQYGRRIEISTAQGTQTLVVGAATSSSANVRLAGASEVYTAKGLSEWSLADDARSYWDPMYASAPLSELTAVEIHNAQGGMRFTRGDGGWTLEGAPPGTGVDAQAIEAFLTGLVEVRLSEPVGQELEPRFGLDGSLRVGWTVTAENSSIGGGYAVGHEDGASVYVKSDGHPFVVRAPKAGFEKLRSARAEDFLAKPAGEPAPD